MSAATEVEAQAWEALDRVMDPCSVAVGCGISLVEMQLVTSIERVDGDLKVELRLTEPTCMLSFHIAEDVEAALSGLVGTDGRVNVRLSFDPDVTWNEDMILPAGRARLRAFRDNRNPRERSLPPAFTASTENP